MNFPRRYFHIIYLWISWFFSITQAPAVLKKKKKRTYHMLSDKKRANVLKVSLYVKWKIEVLLNIESAVIYNSHRRERKGHTHFLRRLSMAHTESFSLPTRSRIMAKQTSMLKQRKRKRQRGFRRVNYTCM